MNDRDRREINRALASALAYAQCGKFKAAEEWGLRLLRLLELAGVFSDSSVHVDKKNPRFTDLEGGAQ